MKHRPMSGLSHRTAAHEVREKSGLEQQPGIAPQGGKGAGFDMNQQRDKQ